MYIFFAARFHSFFSSSLALSPERLRAISRFSRAIKFVKALLFTMAVYSSGPVTSSMQKAPSLLLLKWPRLSHILAVCAQSSSTSFFSKPRSSSWAFRYLLRAKIMSASMWYWAVPAGKYADVSSPLIVRQGNKAPFKFITLALSNAFGKMRALYSKRLFATRGKVYVKRGQA